MKVYEAFPRHRIYFWLQIDWRTVVKFLFGILILQYMVSPLEVFAFQIKFRNSGYGWQFVLQRAPTRDLIETDQTKGSNNSPPKCFSSCLYWKCMNIN